MTEKVLWMDGAENYETVNGASINSAMTNGFWATATGVTLSTDFRTGAYAFRLTQTTSAFSRSLLGDQGRVGVLWSTKLENLPTILNTQFAVMVLRNAANRTILSVQITPTGRVRLLDYTGAQLAVSSREVASGVHNHFELKFIQGVGACLRVNGKTAFTVEYTGTLNSYPTSSDSGATSLPAALLHIGSISVSQSPMLNGYALWDDIAPYTFEEADDDNWLGLQGVYYLKPTADGPDEEWLNSSGSQSYALINEVKPNGDTGFIYTENPGNRSQFTVEPLPTNIVSVQAVQPTAFARKTDSGPGSVQLGVLSGATDELNGDDIPLLTDYSNIQAVFDLDPDTDAPWSPTDLPKITVERTL